MDINRRQFLASSAVVASSLGAAPPLEAAPPSVPDLRSIRNEFPRAVEQVYLDAAAHVPLPKFSAEGMRKYMDFHMYGPSQGRGEYANEALRQVKPLFAKLINAKPSEIAFVMCTKAGEAAVVNGLVYFPDWGGNIWCGERKTPVNWEYYPRTDDFSREFADLDDALRYVEQSQL